MVRKYPAHNSLLPFYLAWQIDPNGYNYNINFSYELPHTESINLIISKLQELIEARAYLRQNFFMENGILMACIHDHLPAEVNFFTSSTEEFPEFEKILTREPHDVNKKSPIKLTVIRFNDSNGCVIFFNIHHIVMDGFSLDYFLIELNTLISGEKLESESADEYILKQKNKSYIQEKIECFELADYTEEISKIIDKIGYQNQNLKNKNAILSYKDSLPDNIRKKLIALSQQENISIFNLLLLTWGIFLSKLYNQSEILVNYVVSVRPDKSILGCFINTVILPLSLKPSDTYVSVIDSWRNKISTLMCVSKLDQSSHLNVGSMPSFAYSNTVQPLELIIKDQSYLAKNYPQMAASNLSVKYREKSGFLIFTCELIEGIFPEYFTASLLSRFFKYLSKLLDNPSSLITASDLTFIEEKNRILYNFNNTDLIYFENNTLVELFDKIVIAYPDNIAVKAFNGTLSYLQLNEKAERLADFFINQKIMPDEVVGILIDNRLEMIISIIAVLKAGAAYLPISPNTPINNINYMLKDGNVRFLLTMPHLAEGVRAETLVLDVTNEIAPCKKYTRPSINPNNLAYVIYTSGTTGNPKGVLIEHKAIVNVIRYYLKSFQITNISNCSKYAEFGFDASVIEIFPALLSGATLHIIPDQQRKNISAVKNFFDENKINFGFLPTQFAELFLNYDSNTLNYLIVAGEKLTKYYPVNFHIVNSYGATETSVHVTSVIINKQYDEIPIGKPIDNVKCYVLDNDLNLLPIGLVGELLVGGESLARGYLNNSALNYDKFIRNPFQTEREKMLGRNMRLYKTGDLVRWLPDGNLEYIGRNDFQVKISGYRVELGEIESKLAFYPKIKQVVVLLKNDLNSQCLVVYYVAEKKIKVSKLRNYLLNKLPEYMIPNIFIQLKELPLTINGKIDRKSFPDLSFKKNNNYVPPSNQKELLICDEFSKILGFKLIGVNDDFFKLGGNSLKAIRLVVNLKNNFCLNVADIFNLKTPRNIAKHNHIIKDSLKKNLENIKLAYKLRDSESNINKYLDFKKEKYFSSFRELVISCRKKPINNVLLTGVTGFLGCNLLNQLIISTNFNIFLVIRSKSYDEAFNRINKKFKFYFDQELDHVLNTRLFVFSADIEKENLGLSEVDYKILAIKIDSIIHSAALIKHYGDYDDFYSANVKCTINLLELAKLTRLKDFHYISTISVLNKGHMLDDNHQHIFTEDDIDIINNLDGRTNAYVKSKCQAEKEVFNYRQYGITSNIYRVGNLAFMANNGLFQENINDNGFFNRLKCFLKLGVIAKEICMEQVSPVDLTAQAIVKLFDKEQLSNQVYHVFNPYLFDICDVFFRQGAIVKTVTMNQFIDKIINFIDHPKYQDFIERFLLHQGWLNEGFVNLTELKILQDKTQYILAKLDFEWQPIINTKKITENILI